jgi:hypothetical protein
MIFELRIDKVGRWNNGDRWLRTYSDKFGYRVIIRAFGYQLTSRWLGKRGIQLS